MVQPGTPQDALPAAESLFASKRYRAACTAFAKLADSGTRRTEANRGMARALAELGNYEEAAARLEVAIGIDPRDEATYGELHKIWRKLSEPQLLIAQIKRRVDGIASPAAHAAWAKFLADRDQTELALTEYETAAELNMRDAKFCRRWGNALTRAGRHDEALDQYEQAIRFVVSGAELDVGLFASVYASLEHVASREDRIARIRQIVALAPDASVRLQWARILYVLGHDAQAVTEYESALTAHPDALVVWMHWGDSLVRVRKHDAAIEKYAHAIESVPTHGPAYDRAAAAIAELPYPDTAIADLQHIVDHANQSSAHDLWARALMELGKASLASAQFERAGFLPPNDVSSIEWAAALLVLGENRRAALKLGDAIRRPFDAARFETVLVDTLRASTSTDLALQLIQQGVDHIDPIDAGVVYVACARSLVTLEHMEAALGQYSNAEVKSPANGEINLEKGSVLAQLERFTEALEQLTLAIAKHPYNKDVFDRISECLIKTARENRQPYIDAVQANVGRGIHTDAYLHWAQALSKLGERTSRIRDFERAIESDTDNANLHVALGLALGCDRQYLRAVDSFARAVTLSSGDLASLQAALEGFAGAYAHLDNDQHVATISAAIATIDGAVAYGEWGVGLGRIGFTGAELAHAGKALEKWPSNAQTRAWYAARLVDAGRTDEGLVFHRMAAEQTPGDPYVHNVWGVSLLRLRRFPEAAERFARVVELGKPDGCEGYFNWAVAIDGTGLCEAAIEKYLKRIAMGDDLAEVAFCLHNIAHIRDRQGDYVAAASEWARAIAAYDEALLQPADDSTALTFLYRGYVLHETNRDFDAASESYAAALRLDPKNVEALAAIAKLNLNKLEDIRLGGRDTDRTTEYQWAAREAYNKAKRILASRLEDLTTAPTLVELGQLHLVMSENEAAKTCFKKALELDKESAEALALLGQTYIRTEEFRSALTCAKAAVMLDPQNLAYRANLAEAHLKLNELDNAEAEYGRVLAIAPCHVDALIGQSSTYISLAEDLQKNGRSSDAEDMFARALEQIPLAVKAARSMKGSRQLSLVEHAALSYSRGYVNVKCYEAQTLAQRDRKLLDDAIAAFEEVPLRDANYHKAQRAKLKIRASMRGAERVARRGGELIFLAAVIIFVTASFTFFVGKPGFSKSFRVSDESVQMLKAAKAPDDAVIRLQALVGQEAVPKTEFDSEIKSAIGADWAKRFGDTIGVQALSSTGFRWQETIETGYYALLSFGSLMFAVAGLYLNQLSKLRFGSFELEKTSETESKVIERFDISK